MKWNDLIEQIMHDNKGIASLNLLYQEAGNYKELPAGDWRKTLRGVLYREVKKGRFKKVGLGVYSLAQYDNEKTAYSYAESRKSIDQYIRSIKDFHTTIEGMLIEIGNFFDYKTYTSDINKTFDDKNLKDLCHVNQIPKFTYEELTDIVSKTDVVWFTRSKLLFPKFVYEVESTTDFTNSMFKMYQLMDFNTNLILTAPKKRYSIFHNRLLRKPFASHKNRFLFRSFEDIIKLYFNSVEHYELKTQFLP